MIRLNALVLRRGAKVLLDCADLALHAGSKVGVVGANGVGKSSLFSLLRSELYPDAGELEMSRMVIAHIIQETPALACSALDYVLDGDYEFRRIEKELADTTIDDTTYAELLSQFEHIDGYTAPARAAKLLSGLGIDETNRPVSSFSGGWRMRLNLAQALMCPSDLLLLDEPTNHLDLETIVWLENKLRSYPGTLLIISHDRDFLDHTIKQILHLEAGKINVYTGNYTDFEMQRTERLMLQQRAFERQQQKIVHLESFINRFKAKATKAKQAQSRIKVLERMERVAAIQVASPFTFQFLKSGPTANPLLRVENGLLGYDRECPVLKDIHFSIEEGSRIGLLGVNGAGKSTLIKTLSNELPLLDGLLIVGKGLRIGYFAQHQLQALRLDESPLWHMQHIEPDGREQIFRDYLGGFNFRADMVKQKVATFSGGEKTRLALALLIWKKPNLLLLDEPTNHLDMEMREALTLALQDFEGALWVVSHDRHLLRASVNDFWIVENGGLGVFNGDLEDYADYNKEKNDGQKAGSVKSGSVSGSHKNQKRQAALERQGLSVRRQPVEARLIQIEAELHTLQTEHRALTLELAKETLYMPDKQAQLQKTLCQEAGIKSRLETLEAEWLTLSTELEAL